MGPAGVALREIGGLMRAFVALWASAQGLASQGQLQGRSLGPGEPAAIGASGKTATKRSRITPAPHHGPRGYAHASISQGVLVKELLKGAAPAPRQLAEKSELW